MPVPYPANSKRKIFSVTFPQSFSTTAVVANLMPSTFLFCGVARKTRNGLEPQRLYGCVPSSRWSFVLEVTRSSLLFFPPETVLCTLFARHLVHTTLCCYFNGLPLASTYGENSKCFLNVVNQPKTRMGVCRRAGCSAVFQCLGFTSSQSQVPREEVCLCNVPVRKE